MLKMNDNESIGCLSIIVALLMVGTVIGLIVLGNAAVSTYTCKAKYEIKRQPQYGIISGCTLLDDNGERIPATNFRRF